MADIRLGLVGAAGSIAGLHLGYYDKINGLKLAAVADGQTEKLKPIAQEHDAALFDDGHDMIASGQIDALFIATPHDSHPVYAAQAFDAGIHVLCEKPVAVTALDAEKLNDAYHTAQKKHSGLLFAGMFNQRNRTDWRAVKRLCTDGSIGELVRVSWTITDWFRSQNYYNSGGWRGSWAGEGGGVLINQCPHNLDLLQWFVGMPSRLTATVGLGKHHDIEVEDDVTALLEFPNGATGTFCTSTGQTPGVNRLEIVGDHGTLIVENETLVYHRNHEPVSDFTQSSNDGFAHAPADKITLQPGGENLEHEAITRNFIQTLLKKGAQNDLIAPGTEMIHSLELGNAMLLAGLTRTWVNLPTDRDAFVAKLEELKAHSASR